MDSTQSVHLLQMAPLVLVILCLKCLEAACIEVKKSSPKSKTLKDKHKSRGQRDLHHQVFPPGILWPAGTIVQRMREQQQGGKRECEQLWQQPAELKQPWGPKVTATVIRLDQTGLRWQDETTALLYLCWLG